MSLVLSSVVKETRPPGMYGRVTVLVEAVGATDAVVIEGFVD